MLHERTSASPPLWRLLQTTVTALTVAGLAHGQTAAVSGSPVADGSSLEPEASATTRILERLTHAAPPVVLAAEERALLTRHARGASALLLRVADEPGPPERARAVLWMLAETGTRDTIVPAIRLANRSPHLLGEPLRAALVPILRRHASASRDVAGVLGVAVPELMPYLARALGEVGEREGLGTLTRMLGRSPGADGVVLEELARIARGHSPPHPAQVEREIRPYLWSSKDGLPERAAHALGALEDMESASALIDALGAGDGRLTVAAHSALRAVTGQPFPAGVELWTAWSLREERWWRDEAPALLEQLAHEGRAELVAAVRRLTGHRAFRHQIAPAVARLLEHPDLTVREIACTSLVQLGSPAAVPALKEALGDGELTARAGAALESLARPVRSAQD